jgi:hypothetical protein
MTDSGTAFDVTTLGETMLRLLGVPAGERLEMADQLDLRPGGAESNVATLLARLGTPPPGAAPCPLRRSGRLAANQLRLAGGLPGGGGLESQWANGALFCRICCAAPSDRSHLRLGRLPARPS